MKPAILIELRIADYLKQSRNFYLLIWNRLLKSNQLLQMHSPTVKMSKMQKLEKTDLDHITYFKMLSSWLAYEKIRKKAKSRLWYC